METLQGFFSRVQLLLFTFIVSIFNQCVAVYAGEIRCSTHSSYSSSHRKYVTCPEQDQTTAYCCDRDGEFCCYDYKFYYTWYFWCACFVVVMIALALLVTCCKAYYAKTRRVTTTTRMPPGYPNAATISNRYAFDVERPHRRTSLPMYDFPPSYEQIRRDGIDKSFQEFHKPTTQPLPPGTPSTDDASAPPY